MSHLVADCPRCNSTKITFDVLEQNHFQTRYDWQYWFEAFAVCRHCHRATVFVLSQKNVPTTEYLHQTPLCQVNGTVNHFTNMEGFVSTKDTAASAPPEYLPADVEAAFREGATCMAIGCFNAAATMFRLCIDHATRGMLPPEDVGEPSKAVRRSLGLRLPWLIAQGKIPQGLEDLSKCIKEDGNDGAHLGSLTIEDAKDIEDFTFELLTRLYTEPARLELARQRREERRKQK